MRRSWLADPMSPVPGPTGGGLQQTSPVHTSPPIGQLPFGVLPVGTIGPAGLVRRPGGARHLPGETCRIRWPRRGACGVATSRDGRSRERCPTGREDADGADGASGGWRPSVAVGVRSRRAGGRPGMRRRRTDPDDPWAVREGSPAVLEPAAGGFIVRSRARRDRVRPVIRRLTRRRHGGVRRRTRQRSACDQPTRSATHSGTWVSQVPRAHQISQGENVVVAVIDTGVDADHPDLQGSVLAGTDLTPWGNEGTGRPTLRGTARRWRGLSSPMAGPRNCATSQGPADPDRIRCEGFTIAIHDGIEWASPKRSTSSASLRRARASVNSRSGPARDPGRHRRGRGRGQHTQSKAWSIPLRIRVWLQPPVWTAGQPRRRIGHRARGGPGSSRGRHRVHRTGGSPALTGYSRGTGTSDATAIIAGAAALVRSEFPDLSAEEVVHRLTATADDKGPPGRDPEYGYGIVNLVKALTADVPPLAQSSGPQPSTDQANPPAGAPISASTWVVIGVLGLVALIGAVAVGIVLRRGPS